MAKCQKCEKEALLWKVDSYDGSPPDLYYFCEDHARKFGFCLGCGYFLAGVEYYEFSEGYLHGYCQPCWTGLNEEFGGYLEEEEEFYI